MPGIIAAAILTFIPAIGDYVTPDLLGGAQTTTAAKLVQVLFTTGRDWPYGSALGFILMVITLAGTLLALRSLRRETLRVSTAQPLAARRSRSSIYAFLFAPIVVLIIFSFNNSRRTFVWRGFTLDWYPQLFANERPAGRAPDLAPGRGRDRRGRRDDPRVAPGVGAGPTPVPRQRRRRDAPPAADGDARDHHGDQPADLLLQLPCRASPALGQISLAHITFCISYVAVVVRARAVSMDPSLEEAARDLGASAWGAFRYVTLPLHPAGGARRRDARVRAVVRRPRRDVVQLRAVGSTTLPVTSTARSSSGSRPRSTRSRRSSWRSWRSRCSSPGDRGLRRTRRPRWSPSRRSKRRRRAD